MDFRPPEAAGLSCARSALLLKSLKKGVLRAAGEKNEGYEGVSSIFAYQKIHLYPLMIYNVGG